MIVEVTQPDTTWQATAQGREGARRLKEVTGQVLGSVFFGTLMKMMREGELKGSFGHGGRGESVFAAQLQGIYAERLGSALQTQLSDAFYRTLEAQQLRISEQRAAGHEPEQGAATAAALTSGEESR